VNQPREFDRTEAVRLRRIKDCFEADRPGNSEMLAAIRRYNQVKSRPRPLLSLRAAWVIAAAMMLTGGALAASRVLKLPVFSPAKSHSATAQPAESPRAARSIHYFVERGGNRMEYSEPAKLTLLPGEHAALIVDNARTELVGPGIAQIQAAPEVRGAPEVQSAPASANWVARFAPEVWVPELEMREALPSSSDNPSLDTARAAQSPDNAKSPRSPTESRPSAGIGAVRHVDNTVPAATNTLVQSQLDGAWSRAASAMRRGDDVAATAALSEISRSPDPAARDAARLAQAQLDLAAGRRAAAAPTLNELAQTGATAFVRQRAREILVNGN
jgi:hypothetical protein